MRFVRYVSREQALERFRLELGDDAELLDALHENPLPASFELSLSPEGQSADRVKALTAMIEGYPGVEEVVAQIAWVQRLDRIAQAFSMVTLVIGLIVLISSVFVISNTVRLTVEERADQIEIMKLVGATNAFIRTPFVLTGGLQGFVAGLIAMVVLRDGESHRLGAPARDVVLRPVPARRVRPPQCLPRRAGQCPRAAAPPAALEGRMSRLIAILILAVAAFGAVAQEADPARRQQELADLRAQIDQARQRSDALASDEEQQLARIHALEREMALTRRLLAHLSEQEAVIRSRIDTLQVETDSLHARIDERRIRLGERLRAIYMRPRTSMISTVLTAENLAELGDAHACGHASRAHRAGADRGRAGCAVRHPLPPRAPRRGDGGDQSQPLGGRGPAHPARVGSRANAGRHWPRSVRNAPASMPPSRRWNARPPGWRK